MQNPIKILIIGNKDTNKEQFIELMSSYGEPINEETIKIEGEDFQFDDFNIPLDKNFEDNLSKKSKNNIILLTIDYLKSDSFEELKQFYNNNKEKIDNYFNVITALNYDSPNKKVRERDIKQFAKSKNKQLFNFNLLKSNNFERKFKSILTEYGKKYDKEKLKKLVPEKEKLIERCNNNIYKCKIAFIGSKSGKSTLIFCYKKNEFNAKLEETAVMKNMSKTITLKPKENTKFIKKERGEENKKEEIKELKVNVELWDTPHLEKNGENLNFILQVAKNADIIVYLYDNNNIDTFNDILNYWDKKIKDNINKETLYYIVENKTENKEPNDFEKKRKELCEDIDADGSFVTNAREYDEVSKLIDQILISYFKKINVLEVEEIKKKEEEKKDVKNETTSNESKKSNDEIEQKPKSKKKCWIF